MTASFTPVYDAYLVLLSVGIAFIGSYITICLCEQLRQKKLPEPLPSAILGEKGLIAMMSVSLGGIAIWSMHFVGMFSMKLFNPKNINVEIRYNVLRTVVSMIAVLLMAMVGLYISSLDVMFGKSKQEIVEIYVNHASKMSMSEVKKISSWKMIWIISTHSPWNLVCGGVIAGAGVSVMHYLGMWALQFDEGKIAWDSCIVAASILIAIIASTAAFWILFRLLSLYSHWESLRVLSAAVMTVAVCGMHYTGMMAADFRYEPSVHGISGPGDSNTTFFTGAENASIILSFLLLMVVIIELRTQLHKVSTDLKKLLRPERDLEASVSRQVSRRLTKQPSFLKRYAEAQSSYRSRVLPVETKDEMKSPPQSSILDHEKHLILSTDGLTDTITVATAATVTSPSALNSTFHCLV